MWAFPQAPSAVRCAGRALQRTVELAAAAQGWSFDGAARTLSIKIDVPRDETALTVQY